MNNTNSFQLQPKAAEITKDFGRCPQCGETDGYVNIGGSHYGICQTHQVYWWFGVNLFSSWKQEEQALWDGNRATLAKMTEVKPMV